MAIDPRASEVPPGLADRFRHAFYALRSALGDRRIVALLRGAPPPDWSAFARLIEAEFGRIGDRALAEAVEYLLRSPPRFPRRSEFAVMWLPMERGAGASHLEWLLEIVAAIDRNLADGGPPPETIPVEPGRDLRLVEAALLVVETCAAIDPRVQAVYARYVQPGRGLLRRIAAALRLDG